MAAVALPDRLRRGDGFARRPSQPARHPPFVVERMSLIVEIDVQLTSLMDEWEIPEWLRDRVPGAFPNSPLDEMLGSTDRIRRIRDLLEPEVRQ